MFSSLLLLLYSRGGGPRMIHVDLDDRESLDLILSASINLVAIDTVAGELKATGDSYSGVYGEFCSLNFGIHKSDPSSGTYRVQCRLRE